MPDVQYSSNSNEASRKPLSSGDDRAAVDAPHNEYAIQDVSAWVLRIGVVTSVLVMALGLTLTFLHHPPSVHHMKTAVLKYNLGAIYHGVLRGDGESIIDMGLFILVLTPIARVLASVILFATVDRDWFYTFVTLVVLILTTLSLLFIH